MRFYGGGLDYTWLDCRAYSSGSGTRHLYRAHAHVPQADPAKHCALLHLDIPRYAAANPIGHRLHRVAAARHSTRRGNFGARRLDLERNSVSIRNHPQRLHGRAGGTTRSRALTRVAALARDLEGNIASGVPIDDSATRQLGERATQGHINHLHNLNGRVNAP